MTDLERIETAVDPRDLPGPFRHRVTNDVRFADTDAMGHVNNAVYLTYCETARIRYWTDVTGEPVAARHHGAESLILAEARITYRAQRSTRIWSPSRRERRTSAGRASPWSTGSRLGRRAARRASSRSATRSSRSSGHPAARVAAWTRAVTPRDGADMDTGRSCPGQARWAG
ncbi:MAG: acyl-CoA thioesterase [Candidatus Limnocylindrales bacterium]